MNRLTGFDGVRETRVGGTVRRDTDNVKGIVIAAPRIRCGVGGLNPPATLRGSGQAVRGRYVNRGKGRRAVRLLPGPGRGLRPLVRLRCVGILICVYPKVRAENSASSSSDTV